MTPQATLGDFSVSGQVRRISDRARDRVETVGSPADQLEVEDVR